MDKPETTLAALDKELRAGEQDALKRSAAGGELQTAYWQGAADAYRTVRTSMIPTAIQDERNGAI